MRKIALSRGFSTLVDNDDFDFLSKYKWSYHEGYATRKITLKSGKRKILWMHREIMKLPKSLEVDHKDGNGLNNQKYNLRPSTRIQNCQNTRLRSNNTSGFKGVSFFKTINKFRAYITSNKKIKHLGYFYTAKDAAKAYDKAAKELYGEFAKLNFCKNNQSNRQTVSALPCRWRT